MEKLKCDDIHCKKVMLDPQSTGHVLYFIYESQERSEQSCQYLMVFEEGTAKPLEFQSPLTKHVLFLVGPKPYIVHTAGIDGCLVAKH
jgi:hypothetical protein